MKQMVGTQEDTGSTHASKRPDPKIHQLAMPNSRFLCVADQIHVAWI